MAANALPHSIVQISAPSCSKRLFFSSRPLTLLTARRSPLPGYSLDTFVAGMPSSLNPHIRHLRSAAATSGAEEGEAEVEDAEEQSDVTAEYQEGSVLTTEEKRPMRPIIKLGDIMGILNQRAIEAAEKQRPVPDLRTGDIVEIKLEVPENRKRLSVYKGIIISKQNAGIHTTIRIRRIIAGIGVEIVFPIYSPNIKEIKVVNRRKVRRARLYYLRHKLPRFSTFK